MCGVIRVRLKRLDGLSADQQEKILTVLLSSHPAIQLSSYPARSAARDTPFSLVNGKKFQDCRGHYNCIFVLEMELHNFQCFTLV